MPVESNGRLATLETRVAGAIGDLTKRNFSRFLDSRSVSWAVLALDEKFSACLVIILGGPI